MGENDSIDLPLAHQVEGLLFVAAEPVMLSHLAEALEVAPSMVEAALGELELSLRSRGLRLQRHSGRVQLTTAPQLAPTIERFLGLEARTHLSRAAIETLAIIAYQPEFLQHFGLSSVKELPPMHLGSADEDQHDSMLKG